MGKVSAGILVYRRGGHGLEVLLVHPGGPVWAKRDLGAWSAPKGEADAGEDLLAAAKREFEEELGSAAPGGTYLPLGTVTQKSGKVIHAWAIAGEFDTASVESNTFTMEWPPRSGKREEFPEVDRAAFFGLEEAKQKINPAQVALLERLAASARNT